MQSQTGDAVEVTAISGNKRQVMAKSCRGDKQVIIGNEHANRTEPTSYVTEAPHNIQV